MANYSKEEIKKLINDGFELELIALEFDIPIKQLKKYKEEIKEEEKLNLQEKEIKELINKGFELELIALEFDIPIEQLEKYRKKIIINAEKERNKTELKPDIKKGSIANINLERERKEITEKEIRTQAEEKISKPITTIYNRTEVENNKERNITIKIQEMRRRYKELYYTNENKNEIVRKSLEEENKLVNIIIGEIKKEVNSIKEDTVDTTKEQIVRSIIKKIKEIRNDKLTVEQAECIVNLIYLEKLQKAILEEEQIYYKKNWIKTIMVKKLAEAIYSRQDEIDDIEQLKELDKKLPMSILKDNYIAASRTKSKLADKISRIEQEQAINRIKNSMPTKVLSIVDELVKGTLDIEKANIIIEEEIEKRQKRKSNSKFALTKKQEKSQLLINIRKEIVDNFNKYHIDNPKSVIFQLQELAGGEQKELAIGAVVNNLINRKNFEVANNICDDFINEYKEDEFKKRNITLLRRKVRNAEIGNMILKGLEMKEEPKKVEKYFLLIEEGIKRNNIKLEAIHLGKSQSGKSITLADIWEEKRENILC